VAGIFFFLAFEALAQTQIPLDAAPPSAFSVNFSPYTASVSSVGSSSTALPAFLIVNNNISGPYSGQSQLNVAILAGSPAAGISGQPYLYSLIGQGAVDTVLPGYQPGYVNGPIIAISSSAALTLSNPGVGSFPIFFGNASPIQVGSNGAPGYLYTGKNVSADNYSGGAGGPVSIANNGSIAVSGTTNSGGSGVPWAPFMTGIYATSGGGIGVGGKTSDTDFNGSGGAGGLITVTTAATSQINLQGSGTSGYPINGITALSQGALPGCRCEGDTANVFGASGAGGPIQITHGGSITSNASNSIGIVASSIGGAGGTLPGSGVGNGGGGTSGPGGNVTIELQKGSSINMLGVNGIGIFAASAVGNSINDYATLAGISGGTVQVTLDSGSQVATGNSNNLAAGQFAIGVLAVSSGTANILAPFTHTGIALGGNGNSGLVQVSNAGTIASSGPMAVGIAALSVGGAGIVSNASYGSLSFLGSNTTSAQRASGGAVKVDNSGSITTDGASAFGIAAISAGAGGLASADHAPTPGTPGVNGGFNGGLIVGGTSLDSSPGGVVTVTNEGTVKTGDGVGGGRAAIGIIAQSIGGGGGSFGGTNPAAFIGDSGGGGGNGNTVGVTSSGNVTTSDDGAIGILAQSIGGGGGTGANAAGVFVAVGGAGGSGGAGLPVTVALQNSQASLVTSGDFAAGILAQSIGGGGGNGGYGTSGGFFIDAAIGGSGGGGGNGGMVTLTSAQTIKTSGKDSLGVLAQSVGGGGGNGGAATAYSVGVAFSTAIALGGTGGSGGSGEAVTVSNDHQIFTTGPDSIGVIAQSIGGGGGAGGASTAKSLAVGVPDIPSISISMALGASGGGGGSGGGVIINNAGQITTNGDGAHGLLAQSVGGGGGNGGDSTAASHALESSSGTLQISLALGAKGGVAGNGGPVTVISGSTPDCSGCFAQIYTGGQNAAGIAAQSVGGGGGNSTAGNAGTGAPNTGATTGKAFSFAVSLGASAGAGGAGEAVSVTNGTLNGSGNFQNLISTTGSGSPGILAQSIGGGGGNAGGGSAGGSENRFSANVAVGGSAGAGSTGGLIIVDNYGTITTTGGDAVGILAQSIGGGGGVAGTTDASASITALGQVENTLNPSDSRSFSANVAVGGAGGSGAFANTVTIGNFGPITTSGERAYGIEAQSIGGGGGNGGAASSTSSGSTNSTYSGSVTVGGDGGVSGNGGMVNVASGGAILTAGYNADGILAQAVGGGGGVGGDGSVSASTTIGIGIGVSGNGGSSGIGGNVSVSTNVGGTITTLGDDAAGILAQSIGGGGGTGTAGCTNSISAGLTGKKATACFGNIGISSSTNGPAEFLPRSDASLTVGGGASSSGGGNNVTVSVSDAIFTIGARSMGIIAQSIGGGGGYAAGAAQTISNTSLTASPGANSGTGGPIMVNLASTGSINTSGAGAWGILAQSIGGGGGFSGDPSLSLAMPVSNTLAQAGKGNAFANTVAVNISGNISTTGANAHGIFAQSIGGSGGVVSGCCQSTTSVALAGNIAQIRGETNATYWGQGGQVNIMQFAGSSIQTSGPGSIGIFAQSSGNQFSQNPITINIAGTVDGGTGSNAAGIVVSGGISAGSSSAGNKQNTITIQPTGVVGSFDGISGTAILATDSVTNVINDGYITGSVDLGRGSAAGGDPGTMLNNFSFNAGSKVVTSLLMNSGTMNVAGPGAIGVTALSGNLTQTSGGKLAVDVNSLASQQADLLIVSGAAQVGGLVVPTATALMPGGLMVVSAGSLVSTVTAQSSLLFNWTAATSGNSVTISPSPNFTPRAISLTASETSLAQFLNRAWNAPDAAFANKFGYLSQIQTAASYAALLDAYSARATQAQTTAMLLSSDTVLGTAMSCPVFAGEGTLLTENSCVWAKFSGQQTSQYETGGDPGYRATGTTYRLGGQREFMPNWFFGASIGTGQTWSQESGGSTGSGQTFDGSMALKHTVGPWLFAGSVALASGYFQNSRVIGLPGVGTLPAENAVLKSDPSALMAGGRLRTAYDFSFGDWYVRPYGDFDLSYLGAPGFQEFGSREYALVVHSSSKVNVAISPMVEIGGRHDVAPGLVLRPYAAVGLSVLPNNARTLDASFVSGLPGEGTFQTVIKTPSVLGKFDLGVQLYQGGGFEIKAEYGLETGTAFLSQSGTARLAYHF
jgi:hypothetical protein